MMSVIFRSLDQKILYSIICKNTDKFNKLENKIYELKLFEEYAESDNYFIVNGKKVIKHKTLEENKIKDNDIILINKNEE